MKENNRIIVVVVIILVLICGIIIFNMVDKELNSKNELLNNITEKQNMEKDDLSECENYMSNTINNNVVDNGLITNIENNIITIQNDELDYLYEINVDSETKLTNYRTNENISISEVKIGDYYNSGKIIRNITGDEWEKECIKNLAYCYEEGGNLVCNPQEITNIQNMGNYVIITLIMGDSATEYFNGKDNISTFELEAIAYPNLNIPTSSGKVNVYNLKEEVKGFMFWIGLDKDTINNKYPVISNIEIYDK